MDINQFKQQLYSDPAFQKKWQAYLATFGSDLEGLFGGDLGMRLRFAEGLECLSNQKLYDAYCKIRNFQDSCQTETDRQILSRLLLLCENRKEMATVKVGDWVKQSSHGYYRVIGRTPTLAIVKRVFDDQLIYVKKSHPHGRFGILFTDLHTFQRADEGELAHIRAFFEHHPKEVDNFQRYTEKMLSFRECLIKAGFREAEAVQFRFYRPTTDRAALVLNLYDLGDRIQIVYGVTTIVSEEYFCQNGEDDDDIKLRAGADIFSDKDEVLAENAIRELFEQYRFCTKDKILALKKEKQKEFLQKITNLLKPLGFKKKAAKWTKELSDGYCLEFDAQKSQWSDRFYFNISVYHPAVKYPQCYSTRLRTDGSDIYNWQLLSDEEFSALMNTAMETIILPILNTPLSVLGERAEIWECCHCKRDKCENCWMKKNYWEANGKA